MPIFEEPFEEELGHALRDTGGAFEPADRSALVDGGLSRGRRRVVRRRTAAVAGSALALALVAVGGAYGGGLLGGSGGGPSVAAPGSTTAGQVTGAGQDTGAGKVTGVPGDELVKILASLLPAGELGEVVARGTDQKLGASVSAVFEDGKGPAALSIGFFRAGGTDAQDQVTCPSQALVPHDGCSSTKLADGGRLMIFQGYEYPDRREDTKNWRAVLLTADGYLVDASEYNAPAEKDAKTNRPEPPLSPAQLGALVTSSKWRGVLDTLTPAKTATTDPASASVGAGASTSVRGDVRKTFLSLLPAGVKVTDQGGQDNENAFAVVDDGRGATLVQINVQPDMRDVADELFGQGSTTLPDGTKVATAQGPGEKGGQGVVMWTVDTMRPSGLRVVVSAFNSGSQHTPATRTTPALTMKQLTGIALSQKWALK